MGQIFDILVISSSILGCFMGLSIISSSFFKSRANIYLAYSILILTNILLMGWINAGTGVLELIRAIMWELLFPVTFLKYFLIHLHHPFANSKYYKYLYLPFLITLIIDVVLELDYSINLYSLPIPENSVFIQGIYIVEDVLSYAFNLGVLIWTRQLIKRSKEELKIRFWLFRLNFGLIVIVFFWLLIEFVNMFASIEYNLDIVWISIVILFWFMLYIGIFKLQIAIEKKEIHEKIVEFKNKKSVFSQSKKLQTSQTNQQHEIITQFVRLLEQEEWYKNQLLSRHDLAAELGISEGYFSQLVNQELGRSVIKIINEYRISESKRLLQDPEFNRYSIQAIGSEAGFKSKSVFYDVFKANTGISPGQFRKQKTS